MFEKIPEEIKRLNQWVCIKANSKIPLNPYTGFAASSTNSTTWSDFNTAVRCIEQGHVSNIGFVFNGCNLVGIDIDTGFDSDGLLSEIGADIIGKCHSYTEKSRSGRGFHILVKGNLPFKGRNNLQGVEIYKDARYFITTGNVFIYDEIINNQEAIDYIVDKYFSGYREEKNKKKTDFKLYTPSWENAYNDGRIRLRPTYPKIESGGRNMSLTSLAGAMHTIGYSKLQIYKELLYVNTNACVPPLSNSEIKSICNSIVRYKR